MTDTANAPERIWMTAEDRGASWPGAFRAFRCSDLDHSNDDGPNPDYPEYVLSTHCDELVAAADEEAFARGANWAQEKARVEGRLVIVDSPELATLRADLAEANAKIARLTEAANALVDFHNAPLECKRPDMFQRLISRLAAALRENANG